MRFVLSVLVAVIALTSFEAAAAERRPNPGELQYHRHCEAMAQLAQKMARASRAVDRTKLSNSAQEHFKKAIQLRPDEPLAFVHFALFCLVGDDAAGAVDAFLMASKCLDNLATSTVGINKERANERDALAAVVREGLPNAQLKKWSKIRDEQYLEGKGDILAAYNATREVLQWSKNDEDRSSVKHDLAYLEVMLCEYDQLMCAASSQSLLNASQAALTVYRSKLNLKIGQSARSDDAPRIGQWFFDGDEDYLLGDVSMTSRQVVSSFGGVYVNTARGAVAVIHGRDGVTSFRTVSARQDNLISRVSSLLFLPNNDYFTDVAKNLWNSALYVSPSKEAQLIGGHRTHVLSLVQFASGSFYHWICEALPKLVVWDTFLNSSGIREEPLVLLLPTVGGQIPRFVFATIELLFPERHVELKQYAAKHNHHLGETHVRAESTFTTVTFGTQMCPSSLILGQTEMNCASLPHPTALLLLRERIMQSMKPISFHGGSTLPLVIFASRGNVSMRQFDEARVLQALETELSRSNAKLVNFKSDDFSAGDAFRLFSRAAVVVGAHGGALANIVACPSNKATIVEIGFNTVGAQQYSHIAQVLGLRYRRVPVFPDSRHRALGAPFIEFDLGEFLRVVVESLPGGNDEL